jgi:hypothetical protein
VFDMKILSVFGSVPQVIKRLRLFLEDNKFYRVKVDPVSNEITAERKFFFLWRDYVHLRVKASKENISNIELKVNPLHHSPSEGDEAKELNLQTKIYLYF